MSLYKLGDWSRIFVHDANGACVFEYLKYKLQCIIQSQYVILSITGIYYNILYNTQYIIIKQSVSVSKTDVVNFAELSCSSKFPSSDVARRQY